MTLPAKLADTIRVTGGDELVDRLERLESLRSGGQPRTVAPVGVCPPDHGARTDYDVVVAGGGLSMLVAPVLADLGFRVGLFERNRAGTTHREWNASGPELRPLVDSGLFSAAEVDAMVVARYRHGLCRWHGGGSYPVEGVLDHAVDATTLLGRTRERALERGVEIHDGHAVIGEAYGPGGAMIQVRDSAGQVRQVSARILVDGRGAASPHARSDLLCPTVGGVVRGLRQGDGPDEVDPGVGDILATTEDVEEGRQHIWEAFPGRPGETTVYLFYYARREAVPDGALAALYHRFFELLPRYKRGDAELIRPTFGYIPGWSRLKPGPRAPGASCLLLGDAAARQSPLTYCGFGNMLRSFGPAAHAIARALDADTRVIDADTILPDAPIHAGTGALSMMMAVPPSAPAQAHAVNALLDVAFATLHEMGNDAYAALLRDEMAPAPFIDFLRRSARRYPRVYGEVFARLGTLATGRWGWNLLRARLRAA